MFHRLHLLFWVGASPGVGDWAGAGAGVIWAGLLLFQLPDDLNPTLWSRK